MCSEGAISVNRCDTHVQRWQSRTTHSTEAGKSLLFAAVSLLETESSIDTSGMVKTCKDLIRSLDKHFSDSSSHRVRSHLQSAEDIVEGPTNKFLAKKP